MFRRYGSTSFRNETVPKHRVNTKKSKRRKRRRYKAKRSETVSVHYFHQNGTAPFLALKRSETNVNSDENGFETIWNRNIWTWSYSFVKRNQENVSQSDSSNHQNSIMRTMRQFGNFGGKWLKTILTVFWIYLRPYHWYFSGVILDNPVVEFSFTYTTL